MTPVATKTSLPRSNSKTATVARLPQTQQNAQQANRRLKALLDFAIVLPTLLLIWPLFAILAIAVKLDSPGPVLYRQRRTGCNRRAGKRAQRSASERRRQESFGRTFLMYKLRTMRHEAERRTGAVWAMLDDPRITNVGQWLRKYHLDELPQFFNVLKGEMSLVGPRPERPEIIARLVQEVPEYRLRLRLQPGITGLAQIYFNADTSVDDVKRKLELDLYYAAHFSLRLYLHILFLTVVKIFSPTPVAEPESVWPRLEAFARQHKESSHEK